MSCNDRKLNNKSVFDILAALRFDSLDETSTANNSADAVSEADGVWVSTYRRADGTIVAGHWQSPPKRSNYKCTTCKKLFEIGSLDAPDETEVKNVFVGENYGDATFMAESVFLQCVQVYKTPCPNEKCDGPDIDAKVRYVSDCQVKNGVITNAQPLEWLIEPPAAKIKSLQLTTGE